MNQSVEMKFQSKEEYCSYCHRDYNETEFGEMRSTTFDANYFFEYHCFDLEDKETLGFFSEQDINIMTADWVYTYISEYIVNSNELIKIEPSGVEELAKIINGIIESKKQD